MCFEGLIGRVNFYGKREEMDDIFDLGFSSSNVNKSSHMQHIWLGAYLYSFLRSPNGNSTRFDVINETFLKSLSSLLGV